MQQAGRRPAHPHAQFGHGFADDVTGKRSDQPRKAGGDGLELAREIYAHAHDHLEEFTAPYAAVIDIDRGRLPAPGTVAAWSGPQFAAALRHVPTNPVFNPHMRQLVHVSFKVAARQGRRYTDLLTTHRDVVGRQVTENLYDRHLKPLFQGMVA